MTVEYQLHGSVALMTLNNPPVNGLNLLTRTALVDSIKNALHDDAVKAIVITGAGKVFSGGADIKEFNSPKALAQPTLHTLIDTIENASKPVIAAIHTLCMGGGLELALACHYRIAAPGAQIALPEVKLGLVPGAGGTQRLPRAVGLERALNMIVSGAPVLSEELKGTALFNEVIEVHGGDGGVKGDIVQAALVFAESVAHIRPLPKIRDIKIDYPDYAAFLQRSRDAVQAASGSFSSPFPAPLKCIDAVAAAITKPFDEGIQYERQLFAELVQTTESKALRHAFFGERAAGKVPDVPQNTPVRPIQKAAVIGAGTMGAGIAMCFANAGIPVTLLEMKQEALDKGMETIRKNYENTMHKGKLTLEKFEQRISLIQGTLLYEDISQADIVVEAVFEEMSVKESVFKKLDEVMKEGRGGEQGAILASNTSTLDLNRIAGFTKRPQDVIGMHFFSPAHVMKLLEIVRGVKTGHDVLATVMALSKKLKKTGVVASVCDGFIGNRMLGQYTRQACFLLEEGCLPEQVDKAIEKFGFAMGPFRMSDLAGNDISWHIRKRRYVEKPEVHYSKIADLLCEMGRFGQKTSAGWYDYEAGNRKPYPSQAVNEMIDKHSAELGIERRQIGDDEIVERLVYALINEGARLLEEGIAMRASDIDMVYLTGYGFPLHRGGPMFYADTVGLRNVIKAMEKYADSWHGEAWEAAPLLARLAAAGKTFTG